MCSLFLIKPQHWKSEKVYLLKQQSFCRNNKMFCGIDSYNTFECCLVALMQPHNHFATLLSPFRRYVVRMSAQKIHCSRVKSLLLLWKPCSWF